MKLLIKRKTLGFTIVELLVVIVVIGILASVTIMSYTGISSQATDSTIMSNIKALDRALGIAQVNGDNLGTTNTIYISMPDTSATCANLTSLPTIPTGWSYACVTAANLTKNDGTGWIPVNLVGRLSSLPIDTTNQIPKYWTYVTNGTQYHLTAVLNTTNNQLGGSSDKVSTDGGANTALYETGSNTKLYPLNGLVINGGFEYAPTFVAAQTGLGWIDGSAAGSITQQPYGLYTGGSVSKNIYFDSQNAHFGSNSLKIHTTAGQVVEVKVNATGYGSLNSLKILPNTTYRFSVWVKSENVSGSSASGQSIRFLFSDAGGSGASVSWTGYMGNGTGTEFSAISNIITDQPWTQYSGVFTTSATVAWFHPEYRVYGHTGAATLAGDFWFDDIAVWQQ